MKKWIIVALLLVNATVSNALEAIVIGALPVPNAEILKIAKPLLAKQGYNLEIKEYTDYITPNKALSQKQLDANFFQHQPYLTQYNKDHKTNLVALAKVMIAPMAVYVNETSRVKLSGLKIVDHKVVGVESLATNKFIGAKIGVPNDSVNEGRALNILQGYGFLSLESGVAYPTKKHILTNPYKLEIVELDAALLPRVLATKNLDLAVINSNYALSAKLNLKKDAVFVERKDSPFANVLVVRSDDLNKPKMKALAKVLNSLAIKEFIEDKYKGAVIPAF